MDYVYDSALQLASVLQPGFLQFFIEFPENTKIDYVIHELPSS